MPHLTLSVCRVEFAAGEAHVLSETAGAAAFLVDEGAAIVAGTALEFGQGTFADARARLTNPGADRARLIAFVLAEGPVAGALQSAPLEVSFPCLLRLDEVAFPPGAQAYRHVHPGPGFRHLRWGTLHLETDDHSFDAEAGTTWFEPAHSPVRATAGDVDTRFVRAMVLPPHYEGKPTIKILDPRDAARPKRQVTHRHVDRRLTSLHVDAG